MEIVTYYDPGDRTLPDEEERRLMLFFRALYEERVRQLDKWGDQRHSDDTGGWSLQMRAKDARRTCQAAARARPPRSMCRAARAGG